MVKQIFLILCTGLLLLTGTALGADVEGSEDHPLITRFPESRIVYYHAVNYDEYELGRGKWDSDEEVYEDSILAAGRITRKLYYLPSEHSPMEVYKNYEAALEGSGFEILFSGVGDELGRYGSALASSIDFNSGFSSTRRGDIGYHVRGVADQHYLLGRAEIDGEEVYVSVLTGGASIHRRDHIALVTVVESRDLDDSQVEVNLDFEKRDTERLVLDRREAEGARDHPLISRFPASKIVFQTELEYDEYELGLGLWDSDSEEFDESIELAGRLTKTLYYVPQDRTVIEIFRNYENALQRADFEVLFSGSGDEIGSYGSALYQRDYFQGGTTSVSRGDIGYYLPASSNQHYLAAKTTIRGQEIYVGVFVGGPSIHSSIPLVLVNVIECQEMAEDLISAGDLREQIEMTGKALVYGIYFDTGSYEIKPESGEMMEEIAILLQESPELDIYVVGHTDDQGSFDFNMTLSKQRANAVVDWLVQNHGIESRRLQAVGVGPAAPERTNETSAGRAANRRVELVRKLE